MKHFFPTDFPSIYLLDSTLLKSLFFDRWNSQLIEHSYSIFKGMAAGGCGGGGRTTFSQLLKVPLPILPRLSENWFPSKVNFVLTFNCFLTTYLQ